MTDSHLRELERRWQESGAVEDEAAYLKERVRVGELSQERLELAAYCGHDGARAVLGAEAPDEAHLTVATAVVFELKLFGPEAWLRAATTASEFVQSAYGAQRDAATDRARNWKLHRLHLILDRRMESLGAWLTSGDETGLGKWQPSPFSDIGFAVRCAREASSVVPPAEVAASIKADLIPWALGYSDPVAQRVKGRQRAEQEL